jgi:pyroglutamyl-peptidase
VVVHFGLSRNADAIHIERTARRACAPDRPDAAGFAPRFGFARRVGPESLPSNLPVGGIVEALNAAGYPAAVSDYAGGYVCDATLYRSLLAAPAGRLVGFVHVPPEGANGYTCERLRSAAKLILREAVTACSAATALPDERHVNAL